MTVKPDSPHRAEHAGETHLLCSAGCQQKFEKDPEKYLREHREEPEAVPGAAYTCPMHPEVRQEGPGSCPKCGMALEPETVSAGEEEDPELRSMTRRLWVSAALTIPVLVLAMGGLVGLPVHEWISPSRGKWLELLFASPVVLWGGWPFFVRGCQSLRTGNLNMFTLIGLGTGVAWVYSVVATVAPGIFPEAFRAGEGVVPVYFEAAAVIVTLVLLGQVLEGRARRSTGGAIRALLGLAAKTARVMRDDGTEVDIPLDQVRIGVTFRQPGVQRFLDFNAIFAHGHRRQMDGFFQGIIEIGAHHFRRPGFGKIHDALDD